MNKYGIVLDTNIIRSGGEKVVMDTVFNNTLSEIREFLNTNKIETATIGIPEIFIQEVIYQRLIKIEKLRNSISESFEKLSIFGIKRPPTLYKSKNYKKTLENKSNEILKNLLILTLKPSKNPLKEVSLRALEHKQPFTREGDKGFKDTLGWLSVLEYFSKNKNRICLFVTNNKDDFNNLLVPEFEERTGNKIILFTNIQALKEYFDKEIPLGLELEKLHEEIRNEIKNKNGDLILYINKTEINPVISTRSTYEILSDVTKTPLNDICGSKDKKELIAYTTEDLTVEDIRVVSDGVYQVDIIIQAREVYSDDQDPQSMNVYLDTFITSFTRVHPIPFYITVQYHKKTKKMDILFCHKGLIWR